MFDRPVIRDIGRKIESDDGLEAAFTRLLALARRMREQQQRQRGPKSLPSGSDPRVHSLHAPEVECIGKGKAHRPYEFGVRVSVATTIGRARGGQFVTPGVDYDHNGHVYDTHLGGPVLGMTYRS